MWVGVGVPGMASVQVPGKNRFRELSALYLPVATHSYASRS